MLVTYFVNFRKLNDHLFGKELFIRFTAIAFRKLPSIYVFSYFPFGCEGRMWDLIVSVPDHCLSFYFLLESDFILQKLINKLNGHLLIGILEYSAFNDLSQLMRLWYLSHRRPAKAQASLRIRTVSSEPSLFAYMKYGSRRSVRPFCLHKGLTICLSGGGGAGVGFLSQKIF